MISIKLNEIQEAFKSITSFLESLEMTDFKLDTDYYRFISTDEWERFSEEPTNCVGSIKDDWVTLKKNMESGDITFIDIERFAQILRAIQEKSLK